MAQTPARVVSRITSIKCHLINGKLRKNRYSIPQEKKAAEVQAEAGTMPVLIFTERV